jgi:surfactin synthase thioesterase subunit
MRYWQLDRHVGLQELRAAQRVDVRLLCLPFSGGASSSFRDFAGALPATWQVLAVDPPGHLWRGGEPLRRVEAMVDCYGAVLGPQLRELACEHPAPLVILGHSLGGLVAYAFTARLEAEGERVLALFVNAVPPPHHPALGLSALSDEQLVPALIRMGGFVDGLAESRRARMLAALLPALRADLEACDHYRMHAPPAPLRTPLISIAADADVYCSAEVMQDWSWYSERHAIHRIRGGHLFVQQEPAATAERVHAALLPVLAGHSFEEPERRRRAAVSPR